jgi:hypothetical protein
VKPETRLQIVSKQFKNGLSYLQGHPVSIFLVILVFLYRVSIFEFIRNAGSKTNFTSRVFDLIGDQNKYIQKIVEKLFGMSTVKDDLYIKKVEADTVKFEKEVLKKDNEIDKLLQVKDHLNEEIHRRDLNLVTTRHITQTCANEYEQTYHTGENYLRQIEDIKNSGRMLRDYILANNSAETDLVPKPESVVLSEKAVHAFLDAIDLMHVPPARLKHDFTETIIKVKMQSKDSGSNPVLNLFRNLFFKDEVSIPKNTFPVPKQSVSPPPKGDTMGDFFQDIRF